MTPEEINAAIVWSFYDAPKELRELSTNGGDEDWLVELPPNLHQYIGWGWIDRISSCGDPDTHEHPIKQGWKVLIGSHS
jgi:hypothetical protein